MRRFIALLIVGALLRIGQATSAGPYEDALAALTAKITQLR